MKIENYRKNCVRIIDEDTNAIVLIYQEEDGVRVDDITSKSPIFGQMFRTTEEALRYGGGIVALAAAMKYQESLEHTIEIPEFM